MNKIIILGMMIMSVMSSLVWSQESSTQINKTYKTYCDGQNSVMQDLAFNREAGPLNIEINDGCVQVVLNDFVFFSQPLAKGWKKDKSAPKLQGAKIGDKYIFTAERKPGGTTELYVIDNTKLSLSPVDVPGTIEKIVSVSDAGWIMIKTKESESITLVLFTAFGDPVTIAVR